eukprot:COSAG05_NODE_332_length_11268_cov_132.023726_2_plen_165_part_00
MRVRVRCAWACASVLQVPPEGRWHQLRRPSRLHLPAFLRHIQVACMFVCDISPFMCTLNVVNPNLGYKLTQCHDTHSSMINREALQQRGTPALGLICGNARSAPASAHQSRAAAPAPAPSAAAAAAAAAAAVAALAPPPLAVPLPLLLPSVPRLPKMALVVWAY